MRPVDRLTHNTQSPALPGFATLEYTMVNKRGWRLSWQEENGQRIIWMAACNGYAEKRKCG